MGEVEQAVNARVERMALSGLGRLRGLIQRYPILATVSAAGASYYGGQYGPAIRGGIKMVAPYVGLSCQ